MSIFETEKRIPITESTYQKRHCYRCGKEEYDKNLIRQNNRVLKDGWTRGDTVLICKKCHKG